MAAIVDILPMPLVFVVIFGLLPVMITLYQRWDEGISALEWVSFAGLTIGAVLVFAVSSQVGSIQMQRYLWPLLMIMGCGLLIYRTILIKRGEFSEEEIERGGTSYE
jgi:hypothetical protein